MKRTLILSALLAAAVVLGAGAYFSGSDGAAPRVSADSELLSGAPRTVPVPGLVTLADIGAHSCVPCRMMTPILAEVSAEFTGRAAVVFIDVWQHPEQGPLFGVRTIPTQIFYDAQGRERFRHQGFMDKASIVAKLAELGVR